MSKLTRANVSQVVRVFVRLCASYEREGEGSRIEGEAEGEGEVVGEATVSRCSGLWEEEGGGGIGYKTAPAWISSS